MIKINLLPEELHKVEKARRFKMNLAVISAAAVTVALVIFIIVVSMIGRRMSEQARSRARLAKLEPRAKEAEVLIKKNQQLKKEIGALEKLVGQRLLWSRCLNEVSDAVPDDVFLVKLDYRFRAPYTTIIKGEAVSSRGGEGVIEFIDSLRRSPTLTEEFPHVSYSIESVGEGRKSFEIRCVRVKKEKVK